jgi:hypothetical protein
MTINKKARRVTAKGGTKETELEGNKDKIENQKHRFEI